MLTTILFLAVCTAVVHGAEVLSGKPTTKYYNCPTSVGSKVGNIFKGLVGRSTQPDLCFDVVLKEIHVKIGTPGTNDDVFIQVCSDFDAGKCCKTPAMKASFSDDWSRNDDEYWSESYFGKCKNFPLKVKRSLSVSLIKSNDGGLQVKKIDVRTKSADKKIPDEINFECGTYLLGNGRSNEQKQICKPGPYFLGRIVSMNVTTGKNKDDGTGDNVKYKICSDVDDFCCQAEPGRTFSNDYQDGGTDKRQASDFGDCGKTMFKIRKSPTITVSKDGVNSLIVSGVEFGFKKQADNSIQKYGCSGFRFTRECKPVSACTERLTCNKR